MLFMKMDLGGSGGRGADSLVRGEQRPGADGRGRDPRGHPRGTEGRGARGTWGTGRGWRETSPELRVAASPACALGSPFLTRG